MELKDFENGLEDFMVEGKGWNEQGGKFAGGGVKNLKEMEVFWNLVEGVLGEGKGFIFGVQGDGKGA